MASTTVSTPALTPELGQLLASPTVAHLEHAPAAAKLSAPMTRPDWSASRHLVFELRTDFCPRSPGSSLPSTPIDSPTWRDGMGERFPQPPSTSKAPSAMLLQTPSLPLDALDSAIWLQRSPASTEAPPPSPAQHTAVKLSQAELSFLHQLSARLEALSVHEKIEAWRHAASEDTMEVRGSSFVRD